MERLTHLEKKLLKVIAVAIGDEKPDYFMGRETMSQHLNFAKLLEAIKNFYKDTQPLDGEDGKDHWNEILKESGIMSL